MPPPPGSRLDGEQRNFRVACTRGTLTKMSMAGLIVSVTMSGTLGLFIAVFGGLWTKKYSHS
jgi:hypothetical protein